MNHFTSAATTVIEQDESDTASSAEITINLTGRQSQLRFVGTHWFDHKTVLNSWTARYVYDLALPRGDFRSTQRFHILGPSSADIGPLLLPQQGHSRRQSEQGLFRELGPQRMGVTSASAWA